VDPDPDLPQFSQKKEKKKKFMFEELPVGLGLSWSLNVLDLRRRFLIPKNVIKTVIWTGYGVGLDSATAWIRIRKMSGSGLGFSESEAETLNTGDLA
jgi:hypothetical protein